MTVEPSSTTTSSQLMENTSRPPARHFHKRVYLVVTLLIKTAGTLVITVQANCMTVLGDHDVSLIRLRLTVHQLADDRQHPGILAA